MRKLSDPEMLSIEEQWNKLKTTLTEAATSKIGKKIRQNLATWFDEKCKLAIDERN